MIDRRKVTRNMFFVAIFLFILVICLMVALEKNRVLGVRIIKKDEISDLTRDESLEPTILFNEERVAIDNETSTIYISQNIKNNTQKEELKGVLSTQEQEYSLHFIEDEAYDNLSEAVKSNHKFLLIVRLGDVYNEYSVVYTTLPIVVLDGTYVGKNENKKDSWQGDINCFDAFNEEIKGYGVDSSKVAWNVRGGTSATRVKKPFKVNLKNKNNEKHNLSLCGLGSDDDWILNPMNSDDLKSREKLLMDLWNELTKSTPYNFKMSNGKYVEVIVNGKYNGLYMLQRRVDEKFLGVKNAAMIKFVNWETQETSSFEVEFDELTFSDYDLTKDITSGNYIDNININNFIDTSIFIQFSAAYDNTYKNRFLLVSNTNQNILESKIVLWDTDMSFGLGWKTGFDYQLEESISANVTQYELEKLLVKYPDLNAKIAQRYFQLRNGILSEQSILNVLNRNYSKINESSALVRDVELYGLFYEGKDSYENINIFIKERLKYLDNYYNGVLSN